MSIRNLEYLLAPASVAVVGASSRAGSVGATVWRNVRAGEFGGPVWPVNPSHEQLDGQRCFARIADLPQAPELALVCTPPATVPGVINELAARGCKAAVVMTAGLDKVQKQAMLDAARPALLRILGPNCLGLLAPHAGLNASFAHTEALPGEIAFVSQSGAIVTAVLDWARSRRIGLSCMVSMGEHADVDVGDLLDHLASDPKTRSILMYLESVEAPRKFMSAARAAARNKPVIVVKAGRAGRGMAAAASHTGALAGSDAVYDAAFRRAGMLRVDTLQQLFIAAETLARFGANRDEVLTVMTNGGGAGVMAADAAALAGIPLAEPSAALIERLGAGLPGTWSHGNPVDIIGDAPVERYTHTLNTLLADPAAGAVLFVHAPTAIVRSDDIARACAPIARQARHRLLACWLGDGAVADARRIFREAGIADFETPEDAVAAFGLLRTYRRNQAQLIEAPGAAPVVAGNAEAARTLMQRALADGRTMLDEAEAKQVLQAYGIPVVETRRVAAEAEAAAQAAQACGFPVALKILSRDLSHKSDVGGVALDLQDAATVREAAQTMLARIGRMRPEARLEGFTVQAMVRRPHAQELIVGASVDPLFGPVLLFGQGGTAVELVADRALALPPLNRALAREQISRTRVARLLGGYRDRPPAQLDAIADALVALSQLLADLPEIAELDINPLWADEQGVIALDARIRIDPHGPAGRAHFAILPYPAELEETVSWQGAPLLLRPIRPEDEAMHREFLESLDPEDLRLRLFSSRREMPRSELARLVQIDYAREMAFVAVRAQADGTPRIIGVVRAVSDPDNDEAEFAIIIRSDLHRQGLGRLLMRKMIGHLRASGTRRMVGEVLPENRSMSALAQAVGLQAEGVHRGGEGRLFAMALQARD
ncbi:bifunctional acetate--CoA ligase family protein/GNAT family N-acetyltransferase [Aquabacterium sp.]|uniref:bifunctional acetate--CoA ligase family protein/GNAT family N-acetyltransferase n=1 Tax=Aquabacterium sp. TaxID=1872578 RepID=UPI0037842850